MFSCQNSIDSLPTKKIKGNTIRLDFKNIEEVTAEDFILIDDLYIAHSVHEEDWNSAITLNNSQKPGKYIAYAPSSELHLYDESSGRRLIEKNSSFLISNKVGKIFLNYNHDKVPIYSIINGPSYLIDGSIEIKRNDGERISMEVPENYPVKISKR